VAAGFPLLLAGGAALLTVVIGRRCSGGGVGDATSPVAVRDIPASMLAIYQQVGAQYRLPWEVLAGIGKEECDDGQLPDPSCTPQPGAKGPGVANFAGASGPMQIGIGGAAGDEYDALRHFLPDPSLGPHDPTTAVELAALVLINDKGAPTGQPIDAYRDFARAYNGAGPIAAPTPRVSSPTPTPTKAPGRSASEPDVAPRSARRSCPAPRRGSSPVASRPRPPTRPRRCRR
jgi:hypothetical protein